MSDSVLIHATPLGDEGSTSGVEPTDGGSTDEPSDATEPTDEEPSNGTTPTGGSGPDKGPAEEAPGSAGDNGDVPQSEEYSCSRSTSTVLETRDTGSGTCTCEGADDCVQMILAGVCKDGTWKGDMNGGECEWK